MDSRVTPMRAGVQEGNNQVREEHEIAPIVLQDTG